MNKIMERLEQNILQASDEIYNYDIGTDEYNAAVKTVTELSRILIEMDAKNQERMRADEADATREREMVQKRDQQTWENRFKIGTTGLNMAGKVAFAVGVGFVIVYGIAFEKHDNICSPMLKQVLKDIIRIKI